MKTIEIPDNSQLSTIEEQSFFCSSIKDFKITEKVKVLQPGSFFAAVDLINVTISPKNPYFMIIDDKFLVGKSNLKSDIFDVLYFARRDLTVAKVPSFITEISPFAFAGCKLLKTIEFENDSNLKKIGDYAFFMTIIESLWLPPHVTEITKNTFYNCDKLSFIEIRDNSELKLFDKSSINTDKVKIVISQTLYNSINFIEHKNKE